MTHPELTAAALAMRAKHPEMWPDYHTREFEGQELLLVTAVKWLADASGKTQFEIRQAVSDRNISLSPKRGFDGEMWVSGDLFRAALKAVKLDRKP